MNSYADQIRSLADCLERGEDIPTISVITTLREAAEKIEVLSYILYERVNISVCSVQHLTNINYCVIIPY